MTQKRRTLKKAEAFELASQGLWYIFLSKMVYVAIRVPGLFIKSDSIKTTVALVGAGLAAAIEIFGIFVARPSHPYFNAALRVELCAAVVGAPLLLFVTELIGLEFWTMGKRAFEALLALWIYRYVAIAARDLLAQKGDTTWARAGDWLWKAYVLKLLVTIVASAVFQVSIRLWEMPKVAVVAQIIYILTNGAVGVFFVIFSYKASRSLRG